VIFGLALALACALATSVSFLLKQRGAVSAPPVRVRHLLQSAADLFRSRWFAVGWLVALGAWGLHVGALALAPLSVVQAVLSAGPGLPRRSRRAVLRLPARSATVDRLGHHRGGARDHRSHPGGATKQTPGLRTGRVDHHREQRSPNRHGSCRRGWSPPRPTGKGRPAARGSRDALPLLSWEGRRAVNTHRGCCSPSKRKRVARPLRVVCPPAAELGPYSIGGQRERNHSTVRSTASRWGVGSSRPKAPSNFDESMTNGRRNW
jgi:hypothetical protein